MNTFKLIGLLILCWSFALPHAAVAQSVESYIIKDDSLQVGDTLTYNLTLHTEQQYDKIIFPDTSDFGEHLEIKSRKRYKISPYKDSVSYTLQFFGTEDTMMPGLQVLLINDEDTTTTETAQELISFASALEGEEFKPLKPIFDFALSYWPYLLALLLLLILGYIIYRYLNREETETKPKSITPKPSFVNPVHQLEETIEELRNDRGITERRDFKTFYSKLGDALRLYIERLHKVPALESTTRELLNLLDNKSNTHLSDRQYQLLKTILLEADMVKFAKYNPPLDQAFNMLDKAAEFAKIGRTNDAQKINALKQEFIKKQQEPIDNKENSGSDADTDNDTDSEVASGPASESQETSKQKGPADPKPVIVDKSQTEQSASQAQSQSQGESDSKEKEQEAK